MELLTSNCESSLYLSGILKKAQRPLELPLHGCKPCCFNLYANCNHGQKSSTKL